MRILYWQFATQSMRPAQGRRPRADFVPSFAGIVILRRVKRKFLIDTDTASDDAVALIMALRSRILRWWHHYRGGKRGGASRPRAMRCTRGTLRCGCAGVQRRGTAVEARICEPSWFHGTMGWGYDYAAPRRGAEKQGAVEAIIESIERKPGCAGNAGAVTNVALALEKKPGLAAK